MYQCVCIICMNKLHLLSPQRARIKVVSGLRQGQEWIFMINWLNCLDINLQSLRRLKLEQRIKNIQARRTGHWSQETQRLRNIQKLEERRKSQDYTRKVGCWGKLILYNTRQDLEIVLLATVFSTSPHLQICCLYIQRIQSDAYVL